MSPCSDPIHHMLGWQRWVLRRKRGKFESLLEEDDGSVSSSNDPSFSLLFPHCMSRPAKEVFAFPGIQLKWISFESAAVDQECKEEIDEQGRRRGNMTSAAVAGAKKVCSSRADSPSLPSIPTLLATSCCSRCTSLQINCTASGGVASRPWMNGRVEEWIWSKVRQ